MIHPSSLTVHWLWRTLQDELHRETVYPKHYVSAAARLCDVVDLAKLMWSELALLLGKKLAQG